MTIAITNAMVDAAAALVTATPLTRVTDVAQLRAPVATVPLEFNITATNTRVWMTYNQLLDLDIVARLVAQAEGYRSLGSALRAKLNTIVTAMGNTPGRAEYLAAIAELREIVALQGVD